MLAKHWKSQSESSNKIILQSEYHLLCVTFIIDVTNDLGRSSC